VFDPDRRTRIARLPREKILETFRAIDLLELAGMFAAHEAQEMREAIRARAAELSEATAEA
jgi:hypothetical protein